jgi:hypothetical protein
LTDSIFAGLDVTSEIRSVQAQDLGDTLLLWDGDRLEGFAVCHCGAGSEAGNDRCFIKFAAVRSGADAARSFDRLLDGCQSLAAERGVSRIVAGVNLARGPAYRAMLARGFRTDMQGVAMQRPDSPGYNRADVFAIDDWR